MRIQRMLFIALLYSCAPQEKASTPAMDVKPQAGEAVARGRQLVVKYGCPTCHAMAEGEMQRMGPSLARVGSQQIIAKTAPNNAETLAKYLQDPQAVDPDGTMPNLAVTPADSQDLAAYLMTLR